MDKPNAKRADLFESLEGHGGLNPGASRLTAEAIGVPEADVYSVASFYDLLRRPGARVCTGLSCRLAAPEGLDGVKTGVSCLGQCDRAPAALDERLELVAQPEGAVLADDPELPVNLGGVDSASYTALSRARAMGAQGVIAQIKASGLQGRGGAGFPAAFKWSAVASSPDSTRYLVVNADEGEPGTFKDREVMLRRPHRLLEGVAIAALSIGASEVYIYIRGEFLAARRSLERAIDEAGHHLAALRIQLVMGHGAYICGEETALLEALEGRRGQPRLKPPFPTERGLWGRPTLIHNVETLALVPSIVLRGGDWFSALGKTEPGVKLYCVSGHVKKPGVYELPLGVTLDELVQVAGGYVGQPRAFSPGGASSGFLPMSARDWPLDFSLSQRGTLLGSAGVVVLNDTVDLSVAALWQQSFFEAETCGQCAPCRIGCSLQRQAVERFVQTRDPVHLKEVREVHWEMEEGSICGLGMVASAPLISAMTYFPEVFGE